MSELVELTPTEIVLARMLRSTAEAEMLLNLLSPSDFAESEERQLFLFLGQMAGSDRAITPRNAFTAARVDAPRIAEIVHDLGIVACSDEMARDIDILSADDVARTCKRYAYGKRLSNLLSVASADLADNAMTEDVEARLENGLTQLRSYSADDVVYDDIKAQVNEVLHHLAGDGPTGIRFGFDNIDRQIVSMLYGNLILIAGATGSGKSTVVRNIIRQVVREQKQKVAFHSIEMTALEQFTSLACMDKKIDVAHAFERKLSTADADQLAESAMWWRDSGLFKLNERATVTPFQLLRTMERYHHEGYRIQVVDHLHELDYTGAEDLRLAIGDAAKALKAFAKNTKSIVIALVQLVKIDPSVEPNMGHIRESAKIGEEADKVLFSYRPLVVCVKGLEGLAPKTRGLSDARFFQHEMTKKLEREEGAVLSTDDERVYIKPGKQRLRPRQGLISVRFRADCGLMYDP